MSYYFSKTLAVPFDEAIDPVASMQAVGNPALEPVGLEVRDKLRAVVDRL